MYKVIDAVRVKIVAAERGTKQNGRRKLRSVMGHEKTGHVEI
jgi:hypothetical protein